MKKNKFSLVAALALSGSILFSSCIGSFGLFNTLKDWNSGVSGNKFVNELVFLALNIVPAYELCYMADILVINSIEFWSGSNPLADAGAVKAIEGENGTYMVTTLENGYSISKEGEAGSMELIFDEATQTWSVVSDEESAPILKMNGNGTADLYMADGTTLNVTLDEQGKLAASEALMSRALAN